MKSAGVKSQSDVKQKLPKMPVTPVVSGNGKIRGKAHGR